VVSSLLLLAQAGSQPSDAGEKDLSRGGVGASAKSKRTESDSKEIAEDETARDAGAKRTVKPVTPPAPAGKGRAKAVEVDAQQSREATEALLLYRIFL
jgi:hypothetical protein